MGSDTSSWSPRQTHADFDCARAGQVSHASGVQPRGSTRVGAVVPTILSAVTHLLTVEAVPLLVTAREADLLEQQPRRGQIVAANRRQRMTSPITMWADLRSTLLAIHPPSERNNATGVRQTGIKSISGNIGNRGHISHRRNPRARAQSRRRVVPPRPCHYSATFRHLVCHQDRLRVRRSISHCDDLPCGTFVGRHPDALFTRGLSESEIGARGRPRQCVSARHRQHLSRVIGNTC